MQDQSYKMMNAAFSPKNKWKWNEWMFFFSTILISIFHIPWGGLFSFKVTADWFLCFRTSVMYWLGATEVSYPEFSSQRAEVSSEKCLNLRQNAVRSQRAELCMYTEWATHFSVSSIQVKTLFGERLSYWLCIRPVTWALCCTGVMNSYSQHVKQWQDERDTRPDFEKQGPMMI